MKKLWLTTLMLMILSGCDNSPGTHQENHPVASPSTPTIGKTERWYNHEQVAVGYKLFQSNCAVCHKPDASGTKEWNKPMADGKYPPPPLNGTAHTWHHSMRVLRRVVNKGGAKVGGWMPAFENQLSTEEIDAVLAWVQSHWSDEIYQVWLSRNN